MTTHPSIMSYDRRVPGEHLRPWYGHTKDPLKEINFWERYEKGMAILCGLILLVAFLHFVVEPNIHLKKAEAAPLQDDTYICTHIGDYPIEQHKAITSYCYSLMERGL